MKHGVKTLIKANAHWISACGFNGTFPFKRGNYFSNSQEYYFVNLWYENLQHLLDNGYLDDGKIEVLLFKQDGSDKFECAYVIDERVPKEALHAPYFCGIKPNVEIVRMHHNVPDDKCLCEVNDYGLTSSGGGDNKGLSYKWCPQCETRFEIQTQRAKGVYRIQLSEGDHWGMWVLAWQEDGEFKRLPCMTIIDDSEIIKIDVDRIHNSGSGAQQGNAVSLDKFRFTGLIKKTLKQ